MKWKTNLTPAQIVYAVAWLFCVAWFWLGNDGGGWIMAYTILSFFLLLPLTSLVSAFLMARRELFGIRVVLTSLLLGVLNLLAMGATFGLSTLLGVANLAAPDLAVVLLEMVPAILGMGLGCLFRARNWNGKVAGGLLLALLAVCYLYLKSLSGSILRIMPILDIPGLIILVCGLWVLIRKQPGKTEINET